MPDYGALFFEAVGILTCLVAVPIGVGLWLSRRQDAQEEASLRATLDKMRDFDRPIDIDLRNGCALDFSVLAGRRDAFKYRN